MPGLEDTATIDLIAHDAQTDEVVLLMRADRPWTGDERQLFQLQEKLNTYASFALDGEMAENYPQFVGKKIRLQLDSRTIPDERALNFLQTVHDQLALQEIRFELRVPANAADAELHCGSGCSCHG